MSVLKFKFGKLVRDKIPDTLYNEGIKVVYQTLRGDERVAALKDKLFEEASELTLSQSKDEVLNELVDVYDVLEILQHLHGLEIQTNQVLFRGRSTDFLYDTLLQILQEIKKPSEEELILLNIDLVLEAIADNFDIRNDELSNARKEKNQRCGSFLLGIFAEHIEIDENTESTTVRYFQNQPEKYPQII